MIAVGRIQQLLPFPRILVLLTPLLLARAISHLLPLLRTAAVAAFVVCFLFVFGPAQCHLHDIVLVVEQCHLPDSALVIARRRPVAGLVATYLP